LLVVVSDIFQKLLEEFKTKEVLIGMELGYLLLDGDQEVEQHSVRWGPEPPESEADASDSAEPESIPEEAASSDITEAIFDFIERWIQTLAEEMISVTPPYLIKNYHLRPWVNFTTQSNPRRRYYQVSRTCPGCGGRPGRRPIRVHGRVRCTGC
jgi:hypothetical protein